MNLYRDLFKAMNDAGIRYLIVGGVAVNLHGHRRFTADVDILIALDANNLEKMTALMHELGYIERLPVELRALKDPDLVRRFLEEKGMTAYTFLSGAHERIDVDILAGESLRFDEYERRKIVIDVDENIKVPVISISDLIDLKRKANRPQDVQDIIDLLSLKD